jgi:hypothetical protein
MRFSLLRKIINAAEDLILKQAVKETDMFFTLFADEIVEAALSLEPANYIENNEALAYVNPQKFLQDYMTAWQTFRAQQIKLTIKYYSHPFIKAINLIYPVQISGFYFAAIEAVNLTIISMADFAVEQLKQYLKDLPRSEGEH